MQGNLSGVSNYCFRWCERCPFTERCGAFQLGIELGDESDRALGAPAALPAISGSFADFMDRLEEQYRQRGRSADSLTGKQPLDPEALEAFSRRVLLQFLREGSWTHGLMRTPNFSRPSVQAAHVLSRYSVMLAPKIARAVRGHAEAGEDTEDHRYTDARRTAYLLHLCLSRSLAAMTVLLEERAGPEAEMLTLADELLTMLHSLRDIFPDTSLYPRPIWEEEPFREVQAAYYGDALPIHPFDEGMWAFGGQRAGGAPEL